MSTAALDWTPQERRQMESCNIAPTPDNLARFREAKRRAGIDAVSKTPNGEQDRSVRPWHPYGSKWEADYAKHLETRKRCRLITDYAYEPEPLQIGIGAFYTPDFRVTLADGAIEWHEVKGYRREAAIVRIKAAALRYPDQRFVLVTLVNAEWHLTTVGPQR